MYQSVTIIGNLGKDPEMRYTPSGQAVASFSVGTSHKYKTANGETVTETTWFRVSAWGATAEACNKFLVKGAKVFIVGRLTPDKKTGGPKIWTDKNGNASSSFEVTAQTVRFLSPKSGGAQDVNEPATIGDEDEVPF